MGGLAPVSAERVDAVVLTASVILGTLVIVLAGGELSQLQSGLVKVVSTEAGTDDPTKVGGTLLFTKTKLVTTWILRVRNTATNYESVSRTAGVSVAVHPVVSLPAPGPVPDDLTAGTDQHVLSRSGQLGLL